MSKNGLILLTPTSIAYTGTSATISANGSVSFSAVSPITLNGVFTGDYDNYRLVIWATGSAGVSFQLTSSGTPSATGYTRQYLQADGTTVNAARASQTSVNLFAILQPQTGGQILDLYGPYLSQPTATRNVGVNYDDVGPGARIFDVASTHSVTSSYDGISIFQSSSTMSGRIAVYGMRK